MPSLRNKVFKIVSFAEPGDNASHIFDLFILSLILLNVFAVLVASVDSISGQYDQQLDLLKQISIALFTVEYLLRLWSSPEHPSNLYRSPVKGRLLFMLIPLMLVDLLAIVPFYLGWTLLVDYRMLRLFRLLSILNITRNSPAIQMLAIVLRRESKTLVSIFLIIAVILLLISSIIYAIEHETQPDIFSSIPHAMWWSMATLTTVGYGDVVPHTMMGKTFGAFVMFIGIAMYAVPTGILVAAFYQEVKRKDFIATWDMVAQIPFFSHLSASEIASITDLLSLHMVQPGEVIFKKGQMASSMYFIVSGEVEIVIDETKPAKSARGGNFFGEIGVLYRTPRTATVTAKTFSELLQLDAKNMELFLESHPQLRQRILEQAKVRMSNVFEEAVRE